VTDAHPWRLSDARGDETGIDELRRERLNLKARADRVADAIAEFGHSPARLAKLVEIDVQISAVDSSN
jgi:hypothetical protein